MFAPNSIPPKHAEKDQINAKWPENKFFQTSESKSRQKLNYLK